MEYGFWNLYAQDRQTEDVGEFSARCWHAERVAQAAVEMVALFLDVIQRVAETCRHHAAPAGAPLVWFFDPFTGDGPPFVKIHWGAIRGGHQFLHGFFMMIQ